MERRQTTSLLTVLVVAVVLVPVLAAGSGTSGGVTQSSGASSAVPTNGVATGSLSPVASARNLGASNLGASNGLAQFSLEPSVVAAAPGQTVTLAVALRSSPQIASGAYKAGFVLEYNASALRATNVSQGPFMSNRRDTTVVVNQSSIDNEQGFLLYELVRDPPAGGVAGFSEFATVTFEVREDAPAGSYTVAFFRTLVLLTDDQFQRVTTSGAKVEVDPSVATPTATPDTTPTAGGTGTATATQTSGGQDGGGDDGGPSGGLVGVAALVGTLVVLGGVLLLVRRA